MSVVVALSLLHFLWQGAVIGLAAWVAMKIARTASARYVIGVIALALMAAAPMVTGAWLRDSVVPGPEFRVPSSSPGGPASQSRVPTSVQFVPDPGRTPDPRTRTRDSGPWTLDDMRKFVSVSPSFAKLLLYSWLLGVALLSVRLSLGLWTARRLTRTLVSQPRLEILSNAERLMAKLNIRGAVTVLESALVQVPTAMGWLKPVVLLPAQAMTGLSMAQIDALVAHELAHIRRHDYLVNLLQSAIETLLFYHPAVWLLSRRIRHERELCCDDMAIAACGDDRLTYASALADLESLRHAPEPMLAANGGSLLTRVRRILAPDDMQTVRGKGHWLAGIAILLTVLVGAATQSVQGRQVVRGAQGVVGGIVEGVQGGVSGGVVGGVTGGVKGATTGGVVDGVKDGVAGGVVGGVEGGGPGNVVDQQGVPILISAADEPTLKIEAGMDLTVRVTAGGKPVKAFDAKPIKVRMDGKVLLPMIGAVRVGGLTIREATKEIRTTLILRNIYPDPDVDLRVNQFIFEAIAPSSAPVATAPQPATAPAADYKIQPMDVLKVGVWSGGRLQNEFDREYAVQPDGAITLPLLGRVIVGAQTLDQTSKQLKDALVLHRLFTDASVDVTATIFHQVLTAAEKAQVATLPDDSMGRAVKSQTLYDNAYSDYAAARYDLAIEGFKTILRVYPDEAAASRAQFYIAEAQFASRRYAEAQAAYTAYIDTYTGAFWLADAYYKRAECSELMGSTREARVDLEFVIKNFPDNTLTPMAKAALARLPQTQTGKVTVLGAVNKPGSWTLTAEHTNLLDVLTVAGLQPSAGQVIRVRRAGAADWEVLQRQDLVNGKLNDFKLGDNDTIDVPVAPKFFVQGFVVRPGEVQWEPNLTLERALLKAGGLSKDAASNRITVKRMDPKTKQYNAIELAKDRMSTIIQVGDVITVPQRRL